MLHLTEMTDTACEFDYLSSEKLRAITSEQLRRHERFYEVACTANLPGIVVYLLSSI